MVLGQNLLPLTILDINLDLTWSSCLTPILGALSFPFFPACFRLTTEQARGMSIIAGFLTMAFVLLILCDEKYLE